MFSYTAKKQGYKTISFINKKMTMPFLCKGYEIEVYKDGKRLYTIKPTK